MADHERAQEVAKDIISGARDRHGLPRVWEPVTRYTRAGRNGKMVRAPCGHTIRVYHFAWSAMGCGDPKYPAYRFNPGCGEYHDKADYEAELIP